MPTSDALWGRQGGALCVFAELAAASQRKLASRAGAALHGASAAVPFRIRTILFVSLIVSKHVCASMCV